MEEQNLNQEAEIINNQPTDTTETAQVAEESNNMAQAVEPETAEPQREETPQAQEEAPKAEEQEKAEPAFVEPETDYSTLSREELVDTFESLMEDEDISHIRQRVAALKNRFELLEEEHQKEIFSKYIEDGGEKKNFKQEDDPIVEKYNRMKAAFRKRRQAYMEALEAA